MMILLELLLGDVCPLATLDLVDRDPAVRGVAVLVKAGRADCALEVLGCSDGCPDGFAVLLAGGLHSSDDDVGRIVSVGAVRLGYALPLVACEGRLVRVNE